MNTTDCAGFFTFTMTDHDNQTMSATIHKRLDGTFAVEWSNAQGLRRMAFDDALAALRYAVSLENDA